MPSAALLDHYQAKGEAGEIIEVPVANGDAVGRVLLYGVGDGSAADLRKAGAAVARRGKGKDTIRIVLPEGPVAAFVEGALLATYAFRMGEKKSTSVAMIEFVGEGAEAEVAKGKLIAEAVALARDLANTPSSVKNPAWLAERALEQGVTARVWDEKELRSGGFGGIVAVGQGSVSPPRLIQLSYEPRGRDRARRPGRQGHHLRLRRPVAQADRGHEVHEDRHGRRRRCHRRPGRAGLPRRAGPGHRSHRRRRELLLRHGPAPVDVITQYGGRTVEVLNTDAEGRLVMADALAYADAELDPDLMIDIATLTGAIGVALGQGLGALRHRRRPGRRADRRGARPAASGSGGCR